MIYLGVVECGPIVPTFEFQTKNFKKISKDEFQKNSDLLRKKLNPIQDDFFFVEKMKNVLMKILMTIVDTVL